MDKQDWLTQNFEQNRGHLNAVAYRMLGIACEAEDAVQEAWIRLSRSESAEIDNLKGWLTTVVARICLDMLRRRRSKKEETLKTQAPEFSDNSTLGIDEKLDIASSIGPALLAVLDHLAPRERIAFVLHDLFDISYSEIAPIIDSTEANTRQLASRARRRIKGAHPIDNSQDRQKSIVSAFLTAAQDGNFDTLIALLHPNIVLTADATAVEVAGANLANGAPPLKTKIKRAQNVANTFSGKAAGTELALLDGQLGATWAPGGTPAAVIHFTMEEGKITAINVMMAPATLSSMNIKILKTP